MPLLAIDTATDVCSIALATDQGIEFSSEAYRPRKHSEYLTPMISDALELLEYTPDSLTDIAVSIGPGSFTGLRVGLSTAKGLLFSKGTSLHAVPTLAGSARSAVSLAERVTVLHHSHRNYYFCAVYELGERPATLVHPFRATLDGIASELDPEIPLVLRLRQDQNVPEALTGFSVLSTGPISARQIAELVTGNPDQWRVDNPYTMEPEYLREYEAETYQNPLRKIRGDDSG